MSSSKVNYYNREIERGDNVTILFAIGRSSGGNNDIAYKANVLEICSYKKAQRLSTDDYPKVWRGELARIWIKIDHLNDEHCPKANLFEITSKKNDLQDVINSRFSFAYINIKKTVSNTQQ